MAISTVTNNGYWIKVYDAQNRQISSRASAFKEVLGYSDEIFVVRERLSNDDSLENAWGILEVYNEKFVRIACTLLSQKQVAHVNDGNIVITEGNWTKVLDKNLRPIRTYPTPLP